MNIGHGNLSSLEKTLIGIGYIPQFCSDSKLLLNDTPLIIPGVGNFGRSMQKIDDYNLRDLLIQRHLTNKPMLGICLGMQIFFN